MMTSRCVRLLSRSAGLLRPGCGRRLTAAAAAAAADHPPTPAVTAPPPPLSLLLCHSRHRLTVPRPAPVPAAVPPSATGEPGPSRLTLCCSPSPCASPPPSQSCPPPYPVPWPAGQLCSGQLGHSVLCRAVTGWWSSVQRRFFSEHGESSRHSMVEDMRRTGHKVRETVGHMVSHENIYTVPNALCVARIALTPVIAALVTSELYKPALVCFIAAGVTDLLDGWIARTFPGQSSLLGSFLDPLADKFLVAALFLSLTYTGLIPLGLTLLTVARDLGLITAAAWVRYKSVPPPVTLSRYFDPTFATARLEPTLISKFNTFLQLTLVASTLAAPVMGFVDHTALRLLWCVTAGTTVTSGMVYALLQSSTYKLMERGEDKRAP